MIHLDLGEIGRFPVLVDGRLLDGLRAQIAADGHSVFDTAEGKRAAGRYIGNALLYLLRKEFKPPTPRQVRFAKGIAEALGIELPERETNAAYSEFIAANMDRLPASGASAASWGDFFEV
jgi:hypothetical protein